MWDRADELGILEDFAYRGDSRAPGGGSDRAGSQESGSRAWRG